MWTGVEAIAHTRALSANIILIDIQMPQTDELTAIWQLHCDGFRGQCANHCAYRPGDARCHYMVLGGRATDYLRTPVRSREVATLITTHVWSCAEADPRGKAQ